MKWLFLLVLFASTIGMIIMLKQQPALFKWAAFGAGIMTFLLNPLNLYVAPVSWALYIGTVKGIEVSVLDGIALALFLTTPKARISPLIIIGVVILSLGWALSTFSTGMIQPPIFYIWQVARTALLLVALTRLVTAKPELAMWVVGGVFAGVIIQSGMALQQYLGGGQRVGGGFGHANTLGLVSHYATMPAMALLLAGRRVKLAIIVLSAGALIAITGGSRATIGLLGIGLVITFALSFMHQRTGRKSAFAALMALLALAASPLMYQSIGQRTAAQIESSDHERKAFSKAAWMMIKENPLGVGAVRYVSVANAEGYSERAGVAWNSANRAAPVHNAYLLVLAEMGAVGLLGLIVVIASPILSGLRTLRRPIGGEMPELVVGLTASIAIASIHAFFEWTAMTFPNHYLFAVNAGVMFGLINALQRQQAPGRRKAGARRSRAPRGRHARA